MSLTQPVKKMSLLAFVMWENMPDLRETSVVSNSAHLLLLSLTAYSKVSVYIYFNLCKLGASQLTASSVEILQIINPQRISYLYFTFGK
jgi:hypothetical protein